MNAPNTVLPVGKVLLGRPTSIWEHKTTGKKGLRIRTEFIWLRIR